MWAVINKRKNKFKNGFKSKKIKKKKMGTLRLETFLRTRPNIR